MADVRREFDDNDVVIVTGPSGAGRTTAIHALEDMGFEAIDNMPLSLLPRLLDGAPIVNPVAIGVHPHTRDFSAGAVAAVLADASRQYKTVLLYVDCSPDVLMTRYSETRRRHPLAPDDSPRRGIAREEGMLAPLRARADILIDTTDYAPKDLTAAMARWFGAPGRGEMTVLVESFAYKRGAPRDADIVFDVRFLRNPHWDPKLRPLDGRDAPVGEFVAADPTFQPFVERFNDITSLLLPAYKDAGKSYLTIALGCTGGQHRSVFAVETIAKNLAERGWQVSIRHRELERQSSATNARLPGVGVR